MSRTKEQAGSSKSSGSAGSTEEKEKDERMFECPICLNTADDAVVTQCGHLFCWPCLHQCLETRPTGQVCPVCKAAINKDEIRPVYGCGGATKHDPRNNVPPRPAGRRSVPEANVGFPGSFMSLGTFLFAFSLNIIFIIIIVILGFLLFFFVKENKTQRRDAISMNEIDKRVTI